MWVPAVLLLCQHSAVRVCRWCVGADPCFGSIVTGRNNGFKCGFAPTRLMNPANTPPHSPSRPVVFIVLACLSLYAQRQKEQKEARRSMISKRRSSRKASAKVVA